MQEAVARTMNAGIPFDVSFADIDYMDTYRDFSLDPNVKFFGLYTNTNQIRDSI
jgi:alpha-glucosidase (family GH31 glycosyl hydrolase)